MCKMVINKTVEVIHDPFGQTHTKTSSKIIISIWKLSLFFKGFEN